MVNGVFRKESHAIAIQKIVRNLLGAMADVQINA